MKFSQLKIGDRFHYRDTLYTKSGPLQATADGSSSPQLIMRSANVQLFDGKSESPPAPNSATQRLRQAIDNYHAECKALLEAAAADSEAVGRLEQLHGRLLQMLNEMDTAEG